jgi:hypothetical protein
VKAQLLIALFHLRSLDELLARGAGRFCYPRCGESVSPGQSSTKVDQAKPPDGDIRAGTAGILPAHLIKVWSG